MTPDVKNSDKGVPQQKPTKTDPLRPNPFTEPVAPPSTPVSPPPTDPAQRPRVPEPAIPGGH